MNLEGTRMDSKRTRATGERNAFRDSDRLYRRLRGNYTQADFTRTSDEDEETEAIVSRNEKLSEFINKQEFSERTINEVIARKNATRRLLRSQVHFSSTPNSMTETNLQHQDMSLTDAVNESEWLTTNEHGRRLAKCHDRAHVWRSAPLVPPRAPKMAIMARLLRRRAQMLRS